LPHARIIKILSLFPILTEEQTNAIRTGLSKNDDGSPMTQEDYAKKQAIVDKDNQPVLWNGFSQYRVTAFTDGKSGPVEDVDKRQDDLLDLAPIHMTAQEVAATTVAEAKKF
jgi:hypothetical protein